MATISGPVDQLEKGPMQMLTCICVFLTGAYRIGIAVLSLAAGNND
jgi:hypothetical protein